VLHVRPTALVAGQAVEGQRTKLQCHQQRAGAVNPADSPYPVTSWSQRCWLAPFADDDLLPQASSMFNGNEGMPDGQRPFD
jgi:hypothetical protein